MCKKILMVVLCACILLGGCSAAGTGGLASALSSKKDAASGDEHSLRSALREHLVTPYSQMTYTRPDLSDLERLLDEVRQNAQNQDIDAVISGVWDFYDAYDGFCTAYYLANIRYSADLTDESAAEEYEYCSQLSAQVDTLLDELYRAMADSPLREQLEGEDYFGDGFFDEYTGESIYTEEFVALLEEENELISTYYSLSNDSADLTYGSEEFYDLYWENMAEVLIDLIKNRRRQAQCGGYTGYIDFAYDYSYYRDYTPAQASAYVKEIQQLLVPLYRNIDGNLWNAAGVYASEEYSLDSVREAVQAMGGTVWDAFCFMEMGELYDISYSPYKYNSSFEIYLPSYGEPFLFLNPGLTRYDIMTIAHEFGHFCSDYASGGSSTGIDVAEVFSQGMEYLTLFYGNRSQKLASMKLADSLSTYVEQSCYAAFEEQIYTMAEESLTPESLRTVYSQTAQEFGLDTAAFDSRDFVTVTHFYTNPLYIISYVVSNDAAMQIYEMELAQAGSGLSCYVSNLDTQESYFLAFLEEADLQTPFNRVKQVREFFLQNGIGQD